MIRVWQVVVGKVNTRQVNLSHTHAAVSKLLDAHHWANNKPWALRPIVEHAPGIGRIEVVTIGDEMAEWFQHRVQAGIQLRLGDQPVHVLAPPWCEVVVDKQSFLEMEPQHAVVVNFCSPTTFRDQHISTPFMEPQRLIRSMNNRWTSLFNEPGPWVQGRDDEWLAPVLRQVWVSDIDGSNRVLRIGKKATVSGFVGRMRYVFDGESAAVCTPLLGLASVVGLGAYTRRGLGHVELEPTW